MAAIKTKKPYRYPNGKRRQCGDGLSGGPRVCVTFTSRQFRYISSIAKKEKKSFAEIVRNFVSQGRVDTKEDWI